MAIQDSSGDVKSTDSSPHPEEKTANASATKHEMEGKQEAPKTAAGRVEWTRTPLSVSSPLELHRRCRETIERCAAKLRERQRKMERLQLILPLPNASQRSDGRCGSPAAPRSTPPRPAKRNKPNTGSIRDREKYSPNIRSPAWSLSSTPMTKSTRLRFEAMTTPPLSNRNSKNRAAQVKSRFRTPDSTPKQQQLNGSKDTQESTPTPSSEDTLRHSSTDKASTSSHNTSVALSPSWSQRQQDFMAAIETEARSDGSTDTVG